MPDKKVTKTEVKPEPVEVEEEEPATFDKWDNRQVKNAIAGFCSHVNLLNRYFTVTLRASLTPAMHIFVLAMEF